MKKSFIFTLACISCSVFFNNGSSLSQEAKSHFNKTESMSESRKGGKMDACMTPISAEDSAKYVSKSVKVSGEVAHPIILNVDSLKKMQVATIKNVTVVCQSGATKKTDRTCRGVLLRDILDRASIKQTNHKDRNFYIVASATDNYKATFSWAEIYNNPTGDNVYVMFEENGQPIKQQGNMILICKNDKRTGPRHVFWLSEIAVHRVD